MLVRDRRNSFQQREQYVAVAQQCFHALAVVADEIFVAYRDETPERLHRRHVHQQKRGDRRLRLAIAHFAVQYGVRLEHLEQLLLAGRVVNKHLVMRKLAMKILLDVFYVFRVAGSFDQFLVQIWILVHQQLAATEIQPGSQSHRGRYTLATPLANLAVVRGHEDTPVVQHPYPFSLPS